MDESYYVSHGGKVPVKWTAPEVNQLFAYNKYIMVYMNPYTGTALQEVLDSQ